MQSLSAGVIAAHFPERRHRHILGDIVDDAAPGEQIEILPDSVRDQALAHMPSIATTHRLQVVRDTTFAEDHESEDVNLSEWFFGGESLCGFFGDAGIDDAILRDLVFNHLEVIRPEILLRHD